MKRLAISLAAFTLAVAACGTTSETTSTTSPVSTSGPGATTVAPATTTTTTTEAPPTSSTTTTTTTLPGEPVDIGPRAGDILAVVGVAHDDVLNLRAAPGTDQAVLAELPPTLTTITAMGNSRMLPSSFWYEVEAGGAVGWVSARFVGYIGATDDMTAYIVDQVGKIPSAETMLDLAQIVADVLRSEEPASRITVTVAPDVGDLGEVTIDIVGLGDDAQLGWRLVIFGQPGAGGESFSLMSVEATTLCGRGVTTNGLCV